MENIAMRTEDLVVIAIRAVAAGAGIAYSVKSEPYYCPQPSAASVARLFAPCQAFDAAMGHSITKQEAVQMGLLKPDQQPASTPGQQPAMPNPAQLVAEDFQTMAQEHATVGVAMPKRAH
jgi:hypothetical protein